MTNVGDDEEPTSIDHAVLVEKGTSNQSRDPQSKQTDLLDHAIHVEGRHGIPSKPHILTHNFALTLFKL